MIDPPFFFSGATKVGFFGFFKDLSPFSKPQAPKKALFNPTNSSRLCQAIF
jgi:hypothetical protein